MSLQKAVSVLGDQYDVEIIEKHHNQKIDAPSGTALMLAESINEASGYKYSYVYDRHSVRKSATRQKSAFILSEAEPSSESMR